MLRVRGVGEAEGGQKDVASDSSGVPVSVYFMLVEQVPGDGKRSRGC